MEPLPELLHLLSLLRRPSVLASVALHGALGVVAFAGTSEPAPVATVDIVPTLTGLIGLPLDASTIDGQCRDLDASAASTCP